MTPPDIVNRMPKALLGVASVPASGIKGWLGLKKRIGIDIKLQAWSVDDTGIAQCSAFTLMFVNPPVLNLAHDATLQLNLATHAVTYQSNSGQLSIAGRLSPDGQSIVGEAEIRSFQLMDVSVDFAAVAIELYAADEVDDAGTLHH